MIDLRELKDVLNQVNFNIKYLFDSYYKNRASGIIIKNDYANIERSLTHLFDLNKLCNPSK